jgi:hypothetical protein
MVSQAILSSRPGHGPVFRTGQHPVTMLERVFEPLVPQEPGAVTRRRSAAPTRGFHP